MDETMNKLTKKILIGFIIFAFSFIVGITIQQNQTLTSNSLLTTFFLLIFLIIFTLIHFIFKKKIDLNTSILFFVLVAVTLIEKINGITGWDNIDTLWHLTPSNISLGFPAFFVFKELLNFLFFNLSLYLLPLIFGATSIYVCLVWLNQKKIHLILLTFLMLIFFKHFNYFFSFSRESIIILFSLLFFYFLEKYFYKKKKRNLIAATLFLILACLTKLTGFLLIPFFIWIIVQKKASKLFLFPITGILFYLFYYTNLSFNLMIITNNLSTSFLVNSFIVLCLVFPFSWLVWFVPFIKPKNFLYQVSLYFLFVLFFVGIKFSFLNNTLIAENLFRYTILFLFPFILWLLIEIELFYKKVRELFK